MVFNFPPSRVQQRSIPKLESCTVYPILAGQGETLPQSSASCGCSSDPSVRQVRGEMAGHSAGLLKSSRMWWWLFVFPNSTSPPVGRPCKGTWEVTSNLRVPGSWYFQACLSAHGVNIYFILFYFFTPFS